jgi:N-acetylmuramoyl-L-alanine amidase
MPAGYAQSSGSLQQASNQFRTAEKAEATLYEKPAAQRTRDEYLRVIKAYERVYLITPRTGFADNALSSIAKLYEEIQDSKNAIKTLHFLIHEYPQTPLKDVAEADIARLTGSAQVNPKGTASVENLRFWQDDSSIRVVIDVTGEVRFKAGEAKSPDRYFVDISPARLNSLITGRDWDVVSSNVQKIRVAQFDGSTVRIVLDGVTARAVTASTLKDPGRIVLDVMMPTPSQAVPPKPAVITSSGAPSNVAPTTSAVPPATSQAAPPVTPPPTPPPTPAPTIVPMTLTSSAPVNGSATGSAPASASVGSAGSGGSATAATIISTAPPATPPSEPVKVVTEARPGNLGSRSLIRSLGLKLGRVVIDAGHGGHDTGSLGPTGYTEKELVLDVSRRLKTLIENEMGAEVVMTRSDDEFVPLESRTQIANKENADLFVSIHANSSKIKSVRGVETFFLNFNTQSREALETATRENAASELGIHELQDIVKKIVLNDKVDESRELAQYIQAAMSKRLNAGTNRGVKQAPFVVLIGANMPSILAEVSFISNPDEERKLKTPAYRQQIAESLYQGIKSYAETLSSTKTAGASTAKTP